MWRRALLASLVCLSTRLFGLTAIEAQKIADQVWRNECQGTLEGLVSWNRGEEFASLGIGHFIWYPEKRSGPYQETFPELLAFLRQEGVTLPEWMKEMRQCPWQNREEFERQQKSTQAEQLRKLLYETRALQALFIVKRFENCLPKLLEGLSTKQQEHLRAQFQRLLSTSSGLYALIDYTNFKGEGTSPSEQYNGKGWGLKQVLLQMDENDVLATRAFVYAAKQVLAERVRNAPMERDESRWLKGWFNRLDTYTTWRP